MFYTIINIKTEGLKPGQAYFDFKNLPLPKTKSGRDLWLQIMKNKIIRTLIPYIKKGGFVFGYDLYKNFKLLFYPKTNTYQISFDIYFEDTYNEGEKKMLQYIKKTKILDFGYATLINKYTTI